MKNKIAKNNWSAKLIASLMSTICLCTNNHQLVMLEVGILTWMLLKVHRSTIF